MNTVKYRALAKDGTWRYGSYPCLNVDMGNTKYPMDIFWNSFLASFRRETLGQWTGLLDKQGKEIYEGDIVILTEIEIVDGKKICKTIMDGWQSVFESLEDGFYCVMGATNQNHREVIGNIYVPVDSPTPEPTVIGKQSQEEKKKRVAENKEQLGVKIWETKEL